MTVTKIGVVYSESLRNRRRVIVPSIDDSEIEQVAGLVTGESLWLMPLEDYQPEIIDGEYVPGWNIDQNLAFYLGTWPLSDRCAVIEEENVVRVINADPDIDGIEGMTLVLSDEASIGWTYINGEFISPPPEPEPELTHERIEELRLRDLQQ